MIFIPCLRKGSWFDIIFILWEGGKNLKTIFGNTLENFYHLNGNPMKLLILKMNFSCKNFAVPTSTLKMNWKHRYYILILQYHIFSVTYSFCRFELTVSIVTKPSLYLDLFFCRKKLYLTLVNHRKNILYIFTAAFQQTFFGVWILI